MRSVNHSGLRLGVYALPAVVRGELLDELRVERRQIPDNVATMELRRTADAITASNLAFELTDAEVAALSAGRRPPVVLTVNGESVRVRVAPMGGRNLIGITKANRALLGLEPGVEYAIEVSLDNIERTVEIPSELAEAFASEPSLQRAWDELSHTRRRELVTGVADAKRPETRARRVAAVLDTLRG